MVDNWAVNRAAENRGRDMQARACLRSYVLLICMSILFTSTPLSPPRILTGKSFWGALWVLIAI